MREAVSRYLHSNKTDGSELDDPPPFVFRQFSLSEGAEIIYALDSKATTYDRLKRSKSHSEMTSLGNNVNLSLCPFANDDNVFCSKERSPLLLKSGAEDAVEENESINRQDVNKDTGLADQEILAYDSDETHELRRKAERQSPVGLSHFS